MAPMRQTVVAAAIVRDGRVLACRRTAPAEAAGRWELPGGKAEAGETLDEALIREIGEELGCLIAIDEWLDAAVPIPATSPGVDPYELRAALCHVTAGEIRPHEHDATRWLSADELDEVDWLEPDRPFIEILAGPKVTHRAFFFEEHDAVTAADRLGAEGWEATVSRERFHGEDDDEDHPWVVITDAPLVMVEALVDEYDGWVDIPDEEQPGPAAPLDLPSAPKRIKRSVDSRRD